MKTKVNVNKVPNRPNQFVFHDETNTLDAKESDSDFFKPYMIATAASMCIMGQSVILKYKGKLGKQFKVRVPVDILRAYVEALDTYEQNESPLKSKETLDSIESRLKEIQSNESA